MSPEDDGHAGGDGWYGSTSWFIDERSRLRRMSGEGETDDRTVSILVSSCTFLDILRVSIRSVDLPADMLVIFDLT
jgi:hypothetical protein